MSQMKPWYMLTLVRMDEKARCLCSLSALQELAKRISCATLQDFERAKIDVELERMLRECAGSYDQQGITFLTQFREQIKQQPWYMTILEQMAKYAKLHGYMRNLYEAGYDLITAEKKDDEQSLIAVEIDRMICEEGHLYTPKPKEYFQWLRRQMIH